MTIISVDSLTAIVQTLYKLRNSYWRGQR